MDTGQFIPFPSSSFESAEVEKREKYKLIFSTVDRDVKKRIKDSSSNRGLTSILKAMFVHLNPLGRQ